MRPGSVPGINPITKRRFRRLSCFRNAFHLAGLKGHNPGDNIHATFYAQLPAV